MKFNPNTRTNPTLANQHEATIDNVNQFMDDMHGVVIAIKTIFHGQPRPYADSRWESLIFVYSPNVFTTGAPNARWISREVAEYIARKFVHEWGGDGWGPRLQFLRPEDDPCGVDAPYEQRSPIYRDREKYSCCWRVCITQVYAD